LLGASLGVLEAVGFERTEGFGDGTALPTILGLLLARCGCSDDGVGLPLTGNAVGPDVSISDGISDGTADILGTLLVLTGCIEKFGALLLNLLGGRVVGTETIVGPEPAGPAAGDVEGGVGLP
jgi:hypothetical protein